MEGKYVDSMMMFWVQASCLTFLSGEGFDFNKWVRDSIPYVSAHERDKRLARLEQPQQFDQIRVIKPEDEAFVERLIRQVSEWLRVGTPPD